MQDESCPIRIAPPDSRGAAPEVSCIWDRAWAGRQPGRAEQGRPDGGRAAAGRAGTGGAHGPGWRTARAEPSERRPQSSLRAVAQTVSSYREESCSLRSTADTWVSTVLIEMYSSLATSL